MKKNTNKQPKTKKVKGSMITRNKLIWWAFFALLTVLFGAETLADSISSFSDIGEKFSDDKPWAGIWQIIRQFLLWLELAFFVLIFIFSVRKFIFWFNSYSSEREEKILAMQAQSHIKELELKDKELSIKDKKLQKIQKKYKKDSDKDELNSTQEEDDSEFLEEEK